MTDATDPVTWSSKGSAWVPSSTSLVVSAEATIGRYKRVIGDGLRSHTDERQATEMAVAVHVLNRMLELGRPNYVRVT